LIWGCCQKSGIRNLESGCLLTTGNRQLTTVWAHCILNIVKKYKLSEAADIGADDRFFTKKLKGIVSGAVYAVDTGYSENSEIVDGILCLKNIAALPFNAHGGGGG
jgi:hypothetical protein